MNKTTLTKYARLIAEVGANVQKGQEVIIRAEVENCDFAVLLASECYKLGASKVTVDWRYAPLTKLNYKKRSLKTLSTVEDWEVERLKHREKTLPVLILVESDDPDGLKGVDQAKVAKSRMAVAKVTKPISDRMSEKYQWCIAAVPGKKWAKKVFPNDSTAVAVKKLWDAILYTSRVTEDPVAAWKAHNEDLLSRSETLNKMGLKYLHYKSARGTDLKVGLNSQGIFMGGGEYTLGGIYYNPNIPTEEVFTSPVAGVADGIVYATKPLSYQGELIDNFWVRFKNGKVVETGAEKNPELLDKLISMDEGASMLGECALVPYDSPINNSGILFYNTLFDENCCCHLALGRGFNNTLKGFENMTNEECKKAGINDSAIHVDFMIGSEDLQIDGITEDGKTVAIFKNGNWAF
ncbi:MAG: aminopeptidase [Candidatus Borkfalkiaceae bacterium]|nr:aminopeptidase [Christensenellaceae bacterium]